MNRRFGLLFFSLAVFLSACASLAPEIPFPEVPSEPILDVLEQHRRSFTSLRAVARMETERKGKRRVYESVAVLILGQRKLRVEGFGPLGESLFAVFWEGGDVLVRLPGEQLFRNAGQTGFERLLGMPLFAEDICALLSGNVPAVPQNAEPRAGCSADGRCIMAFSKEDVRWRIQTAPSELGDVVIDSVDVNTAQRSAFRAFFSSWRRTNGYLIPTHIVVENPARKVGLIVEYLDAEVNSSIDERDFLSGSEGAAP